MAYARVCFDIIGPQYEATQYILSQTDDCRSIHGPNHTVLAPLHEFPPAQSLARNSSELRGSEQLSASGEGVEALGPPGTED